MTVINVPGASLTDFTPNFGSYLTAAVIDEPTGSEAVGTSYRVSTLGLGEFTGYSNNIAVLTSTHGWVFVPPSTGMKHHDAATAVTYLYDGSAWNLDDSSSATNPQSVNYISIDDVATNTDATKTVGKQYIAADANFPASGGGNLAINSLAYCISASPELWVALDTNGGFLTKSKEDYGIRQQRADGSWELLRLEPPLDDLAGATALIGTIIAPVHMGCGTAPIAAPLDIGGVTFRPSFIGAGTEYTILQLAASQSAIFVNATAGNYSRGVFRDFTLDVSAVGCSGNGFDFATSASEKHDGYLFENLRTVGNVSSGQTGAKMLGNLNRSRWINCWWENLGMAINLTATSHGWGTVRIEDNKIIGCTYGIYLGNSGNNYIRNISCDTIASWVVYSQSPGNRITGVACEQNGTSDNPVLVLDGTATGFVYGCYNNHIERVTMGYPTTAGSTVVQLKNGTSGNVMRDICLNQGVLTIDSGCSLNDVEVVVDYGDAKIGRLGNTFPIADNAVCNRWSVKYTNGGKNGNVVACISNYDSQSRDINGDWRRWNNTAPLGYTLTAGTATLDNSDTDRIGGANAPPQLKLTTADGTHNATLVLHLTTYFPLSQLLGRNFRIEANVKPVTATNTPPNMRLTPNSDITQPTDASNMSTQAVTSGSAKKLILVGQINSNATDPTVTLQVDKNASGTVSGWFEYLTFCFDPLGSPGVKRSEVWTNSITYDPGSISAGASDSAFQSITVIGARKGDQVFVGCSNDTQGIFADANVSADDTVKFLLVNPTGNPNSAVNIASSTWTAYVRHQR